MQWIGLVRKTYIPKSMHCPAGGALKLKDVFFRKTQLHRFFFEEDPNCIDFFWGETQLHRFLLRKDPTASICCVFFFRKTHLHRFVVLFSSVSANCIDFFYGKDRLHRFFSGGRPNCIDFFLGKTQLHRFFLAKDPTASICCAFFKKAFGKPTRPNCKELW